MADIGEQIEQQAELVDLAAADEFLVNDKDDTTDDAGGSPKRITATNVSRFMPEQIGIACSGEDTDLATGLAVTFRMPFAMTLSTVRANVKTAPTGSTLIVDVKESGTTIFSTKLSIDATEKTSVTANTPAVISDPSLADDAEITVILDQVGSAVAGTGLKIWLIGTRT